MKTRTDRHPSPSKQITLLGAIGAAALLVAGAIVPTAAHAATPAAGEYSGTSVLQYAGDNPVDWEDERPLSFDVDASGNISGLTGGYFWTCIAGGEPGTTAYFEDSPIPATAVEVGEPFEIEWSSGAGGVDYTFEGIINADGTAEGAVLADIGVCGASILTWSAQNEDVQAPEPTFEIDPIDPISVWDVARGGVTVSASGFEAHEEVTIEIAGETSTVEADFFGDLGVSYSIALAAGTHAVTLTADAGSVTQNFEIVADEDYFDDPADTPLIFVNPEVITASETAPIDVFARYLLEGTTFEVRLNGDVIDTVHTGDYDSIDYELTEPLSVGQHTIEFFHPAVTLSGAFEVVPDGDGAPAPAGTYSGTATQDIAGSTWTSETNTFPLTFTIDDEGNISDFETQKRWVCWLSPDNPTGITDLTGMPESRITADRAFNVSWEADNLDDISVFGTVNADGSAAGSIYIDMGSCGLAYLNWSATGDGDYDPSPVYDPAASVSSSSLTESELATAGVVISGEGFAPNLEVVLTVAGENVTASDADDNGEVEFVYMSDALGVGTHEVELTSADGTATTEFTVTEDSDPEPIFTPSISLSPTALSESELADTGLTVTGEGFPANAEVALSVAGEVISTALSDDAGELEFSYTSDELGAGVYTLSLSADGEGASAASTFTVTPDEQASDTIPATTPSEDDLDPALEGAIIAPEQAEAGDTITVAILGVNPGDEVGVWLFSAPVYLGTHAVDAGGNVTVTLPDDAALGEHRLAAWMSGNESLIGWDTVTVVGADGDDADSGSGGSAGATDDNDDRQEYGSADQLPETGGGSLLVPATVGGMLLLLGAVFFWRRRSALS